MPMATPEAIAQQELKLKWMKGLINPADLEWRLTYEEHWRKGPIKEWCSGCKFRLKPFRYTLHYTDLDHLIRAKRYLVWRDGVPHIWRSIDGVWRDDAEKSFDILLDDRAYEILQSP